MPFTITKNQTPCQADPRAVTTRYRDGAHVHTKAVSIDADPGLGAREKVHQADPVFVDEILAAAGFDPAIWHAANLALIQGITHAHEDDAGREVIAQRQQAEREHQAELDRQAEHAERERQDSEV